MIGGNVRPPQNIFWNNNRVKAGKRSKAEEATLTKALRQGSVWPFQGSASTGVLLVCGKGL